MYIAIKQNLHHSYFSCSIFDKAPMMQEGALWPSVWATLTQSKLLKLYIAGCMAE